MNQTELPISRTASFVRLRPHRPREAYLRLRTLPGEQAQVDWAHFGKLTVGRAERPLMAFVLVLSYSRYPFVRFYLNASLANLVRGHVEAFSVPGGSCRKILYDNMRSVVLERRGDAPHAFLHCHVGEVLHTVLGRIRDAVPANPRAPYASSWGVEKAGPDVFDHVIDCLHSYARKGEVHRAVLIVDVACREGGCRLGESDRREVGGLRKSRIRWPSQ